MRVRRRRHGRRYTPARVSCCAVVHGTLHMHKHVHTCACGMWRGSLHLHHGEGVGRGSVLHAAGTLTGTGRRHTGIIGVGAPGTREFCSR